jgi:hypothetical protein
VAGASSTYSGTTYHLRDQVHEWEDVLVEGVVSSLLGRHTFETSICYGRSFGMEPSPRSCEIPATASKVQTIASIWSNHV